MKIILFLPFPFSFFSVKFCWALMQRSYALADKKLLEMFETIKNAFSKINEALPEKDTGVEVFLMKILIDHRAMTTIYCTVAMLIWSYDKNFKGKRFRYGEAAIIPGIALMLTKLGVCCVGFAIDMKYFGGVSLLQEQFYSKGFIICWVFYDVLLLAFMFKYFNRGKKFDNARDKRIVYSFSLFFYMLLAFGIFSWLKTTHPEYLTTVSGSERLLISILYIVATFLCLQTCLLLDSSSEPLFYKFVPLKNLMSIA